MDFWNCDWDSVTASAGKGTDAKLEQAAEVSVIPRPLGDVTPGHHPSCPSYMLGTLTLGILGPHYLASICMTGNRRGAVGGLQRIGIDGPQTTNMVVRVYESIRPIRMMKVNRTLLDLNAERLAVLAMLYVPPKKTKKKRATSTISLSTFSQARFSARCL